MTKISMIYLFVEWYYLFVEFDKIMKDMPFDPSNAFKNPDFPYAKYANIRGYLILEYLPLPTPMLCISWNHWKWLIRW